MSDIHSGISQLYIQDNIGVVQICSDRKNHIVLPEFAELSVIDRWVNENKLKALIITGNGKHFSDGADFNKIVTEKENTETLAAAIEKGKKLLNYIERLSIITISAINGACFGAGLEIALSCQFRISAPNAFFALPEASRGIIPGMNGVERLSKFIGKSNAIRLSLTGEMLSAESALKAGIIDFISDSDCMKSAIEFAKSLIDERSLLQINSIVKAASGSPDADECFIKAVSSMVSKDE